MKTPLLIMIRGGKFDNRLANAASFGALKTGATVQLEREPTNPHDFNAIKATIFHEEKVQEDGVERVVISLWPIGYVAREVAAVLAPMLDYGRQFQASLVSWNLTSCEVRLTELTDEEEAV